MHTRYIKIKIIYLGCVVYNAFVVGICSSSFFIHSSIGFYFGLVFESVSLFCIRVQVSDDTDAFIYTLEQEKLSYISFDTEPLTSLLSVLGFNGEEIVLIVLLFLISSMHKPKKDIMCTR